MTKKIVLIISVICGLVLIGRAQSDTFCSEWRPNADARGIKFVGSKACVDAES